VSDAFQRENKAGSKSGKLTINTICISVKLGSQNSQPKLTCEAPGPHSGGVKKYGRTTYTCLSSGQYHTFCSHHHQNAKLVCPKHTQYYSK